MQDKIIHALTNKFLIQYHYDGGIRIVEPHCYGITIAGHEALRAFQIEGYSSTGRMGWKMFVCSKMDSFIVLERTFLEVRSDYKKGDKGMHTIHFEL